MITPEDLRNTQMPPDMPGPCVIRGLVATIALLAPIFLPDADPAWRTGSLLLCAFLVGYEARCDHRPTASSPPPGP